MAEQFWLGEKPTTAPTSEKPTTTTTTTTQKPTVTTPPDDDINWGDANCDGKILIDDVVAVMSYTSDSSANPLSAAGLKNADVYQNGDGVQASDAASIQKYLTKAISKLPESYM